MLQSCAFGVSLPTTKLLFCSFLSLAGCLRKVKKLTKAQSCVSDWDNINCYLPRGIYNLDEYARETLVPNQRQAPQTPA